MGASHSVTAGSPSPSFCPEMYRPYAKRFASKWAFGRAIYPQGGKTSLEYGGTPRRPGVALGTTSISRLIDYPYADMTITVESGMTLSALSGILAGQQQRLLVDAPCPDSATIGGIYATNTSGPRRFGARAAAHQIIGVSFVTSEGVVVKGGGRVVKNVAGYDLPKLLTGSLGTLGIITQLTLKVRPIPEKSAIAWVCFGSFEHASEALDRLNVSETRPIAVELLKCARRARSARIEDCLPPLRPSRSDTKRTPQRLAGSSIACGASSRGRHHDPGRRGNQPHVEEPDRLSSSGDRFPELCCQRAAVVDHIGRFKLGPVTLVRAGPRRQRDRPAHSLPLIRT